MPNNVIRVLVVDDQLVVRRGLATLLLAFDDLQLVGEASTGAEALKLCATVRPDVVLVDLLMPDMDGVASIQAIRELYPEIQVLILAAFEEFALVRRAMEAGAVGILLKNMSGDDLACMIRSTRSGPRIQPPKSIEEIMRAVNAPMMLPAPHVELTRRERQVLALMAQGFTNMQIGMHLIISRATAKYHVSSILSKLGVATRTEAVAWAVHQQMTSRHDLFPPA